jgi:hypothetical protein
MSFTRDFPVPTLHRMIEQALEDLKQARNLDDTNRMTRAELRMNALLDQLARRSAPTSPDRSAA